MSHPNAPLSYDPLKTVLKHMDPNQRALLVTKCPSLKTPDSKVPQRIQSLCVGPARISINNTTYQLGVIRQYPQGTVLPERHAMVNSRGGEHFEMNKYGLNIATPKLTPGDFPISVAKPAPEEVVRNRCQNIISMLKHRLNGRKQKKKSMEVIAQLRRNQGLKERSERIAILKEMDEAIAEVEADILPYQLRIDNNDRDIPFTLYLQLTISTNGPDGRKVQAIERMEYTGNLGTATKYLIGRLLKKPMNYVNELIVVALTNRDCFWLPAEWNLTARHLIIDNHCQLVTRAFGGLFHRNNGRRLKSVRRIYRVCPNYVDFVPLINFLLTNGARIGSCRTAYTSIMQSSVWYNSMRQREGSTVAETPTRGCECLYDCVILPMPNNAQLEFFITPIEGHPHPFQFHLEVQPRN